MIPRAFRASAIWPTRSRRAKPAKKGITRSGAGGLVTLFWRSVALASTAAATTRGEWRLWVMRTSAVRLHRPVPERPQGPPLLEKGDLPPGVRPGQTDPPPVLIDSSSLRSYPCASRSARAFRRALTYSFELCQAVLHGGALFMTCVHRVSECHKKEPRAARRFSIRIRRSLPGRGRWSAARSTRKPKWLTFWLKTRFSSSRSRAG